MPKLPEKFEDWTPPWKEDEFDAERAAKRLFNTLRDKEKLSERLTATEEERDTLQGKVTEYEEKDLSEVDRLKRENERLRNGEDKPKTKSQKDSDEADLRAARLEIALDMGLTKAQAKRLQGSTREELEADAEAYMEEHGLTKPGDSNAGKGGQAPPSQRPKVQVRSAHKQGEDEPDPDEDLDPAELYAKTKGLK